MINSMTGYGCAEGQMDGITYAVEIKAVNNRFFHSRIKLPDSMVFLEDDIEKFLSQELQRGTINYILHLKNVPADTLFEIDERGLKSYIEVLARLARDTGVESRVDIAALLALPGIVQPAIADEQQAQRVRQIVMELTRKASQRLKEMRGVEGAALAADLEVNCRAIREDLNRIRAKCGVMVADYHARLQKRVDALLADSKVRADEATLAREVAVFAERADVSEEITRLDSHIEQFFESCRSEGQAGRRLDFISQEMLREANTIASKACDTEVIHWVVDIKCRIDRIKEQVQNVE